ncbi:MAG: murein biosynthesis integral membrane protein MurJ [Anaerolineaceae bacterium]
MEERLETSSESNANRQISRSALVVMGAFIFSSLLGLVRNMVLTRTFPLADLDSFYAANRITEFLFNLLAGGALGSAFIPLFTGLLTRERREDAWKLASGVFNVLLVVLSGIVILMWIFAPQVVRYGLYVLDPTAEVENIALTVRMLRVMLPTVLIFGVSGLVMGILNAHQKFLIPALSLAIYNIGIILGTLLLPSNMGVYRLAIGALIGAVGYLLIQIPSLVRLPKAKYESRSGWKDKAVQDVLRLMVPRLIGAGAVQLNFVANTIIALGIGNSSVSAITLGFALMLMPQAAIAQSAGIASLPTLSAQAEMGEDEAFKQTISRIMRMILLLAIPASVGLILLRQPLVAGLYQRGEFTSQDTQMVAWALLWYAVGLVGHSLVEVLTRSFFARGDTKTPVIVTTSAMVLNIILSFAFTSLFRSVGWMPHGGLALANSLATGLECVVLWVMLGKRLNGLNSQLLGDGAIKAVIGSVVMGVSVVAVVSLVGDSPRSALVAGLLVGVLVYAVMLLLLKVPEVQTIAKALKRKLGQAG